MADDFSHSSVRATIFYQGRMFTLEDAFDAGSALVRAEKYDQVRDLCATILEQYPEHPRALHGLGMAYFKLNDSCRAIELIERAIRLDPAMTEGLKHLCDVYSYAGMLVEKLVCSRQVMLAQPTSPEMHSNYLFNLEYLPDISRSALYEEALAWGRKHSLEPYSEHGNFPDTSRRLRIGFISADFRHHPVGFILLPALVFLDKNSFEIFCYSNHCTEDTVTLDLKKHAHHWRSIVNINDSDVCRQIRDDGIDILVDLSGHTGGNRLPVFTAKLAPVQVSWLGYSNTTGIPAMDYILMDETTAPESEDQWFTEKVWRLPVSRFGFAIPNFAPEVGPLPALCNGYCTFGSFNNLLKLNPGVIKLWSEVLLAVDGSRLVIKRAGCADESVCARIRDQFTQYGIHPDRLEFRGQSSHQDMLNEYNDIDIALDPFPFSGGLTSCEAIWMGVPVITLAGDRPIGRQTWSFLKLLRHRELVAKTLAQYVAIAKELARDTGRLSRLRGALRQEMEKSPLCDGRRYAEHIGTAFRSMWSQWCAAQTQKKLEVTDADLAGRFAQAASRFQEGRLDESRAIYEQILEEHPDQPRALHGLGIVWFRRGEIGTGLQLVQRALKLLPAYTDAWNSLGNMHRESGRLQEAYDCYQRALELQPRHVQALCNLGRVCRALGRLTEAADLLDQLLSEEQDDPGVVNALATMLKEDGRMEDALSVYTRFLEHRPDSSLYVSRGNLYFQTGRLVEAQQDFKQAIALDEHNYFAYNNLAIICRDTGRLADGRNHCEQALTIKPDYANAYHTLGNIEMAAGHAQKAKALFKRALHLNPGDAVAHSNILFAMNFIPGTRQQDIYRESRRWNNDHAGPIERLTRSQLNSPLPGRTLRIGYVSGDFKRHPVSYHLKPILEHHDRTGFEVFLYSNFALQDDMTEKLKAQDVHWREIYYLDDKRAEQLIRHDDIDILVDLAGHTAGNRLLLFAHRPAPVQVSWLGYFNTSGMKAIDYLLTDAITVRPGEEKWFTEQIIRLPVSRFCYEPPEYAPAVAPLPALTNDGIVFGSFNKISKLTPDVVALWSSVLHMVPNSRLMLKWSTLDTDTGRSMVSEMFAKHGITSSRLILRGESSHPEMLAQYGDVDIALDPFPFSGGATSCEALWMGVPVVTLTGQLPISRQTAAFLKLLDLGDLVAANSDEYIRIAVSLASDIQGLAKLRDGLRARMASSALCNGRQFTAGLENAFRAMWSTWCAAQATTPKSRQLAGFSAVELYNAGVKRMEDRDYRGAVTLFQAALKKQPDFVQSWNNLGISLSEYGRFGEAVRAFRRALRLDPAFPDAYSNLGRVLTILGKIQPAIKACRQATQLAPNAADGFLNLGNAYKEAGKLSLALESYEQALSLAPSNHLVLLQIAMLHLSCGEYREALHYNRKNIDLDLCSWGAYSNLIMTMNYDSGCSQEDIVAESCHFGDLLEDRCREVDIPCTPHGDRKVRIGYVSADFYLHTVGFFFKDVMASHDHTQYEIYCYSNTTKDDSLTRSIRDNSDQWREITFLTDEQAYETIVGDGIDILVDLSGHTAGNRLALFARKPAPKQATWLGYFNTTGLRAIDYVISDAATVPEGCEHWYREKVLRMPDSRFCYSPPEKSPVIADPPFASQGHITFGCFNNNAKITPEVVAVWSRILAKLPDSRLVLKWKTFEDRFVRNRYLKMFAQSGIDARRIELRGQSSHYQMLSEYNDIDIALDPFPFTGGITSCEALWMGVPVVTFAGERPVSRQTLGFLRAVELNDLVACDMATYEAIAIALAHDRTRLVLLRQTLRGQMASSYLCDANRFTRNLEHLFQQMLTSCDE